ncbi:hypothetical protein ACF1GW_19665 [Streptomyces achromogenes]|uniref:hypothetical protein n=1 Tax=Streptomyces achromogenes TaxID=67255 RepID=UPI0036FDF612
MDSMTVDRLDSPEFTDRYTEAIARIIEAEREDKPLPAVEEPKEPAQVLDLMAPLREPVSEAKATRGDPGPADVRELPQPQVVDLHLGNTDFHEWSRDADDDGIHREAAGDA